MLGELKAHLYVCRIHIYSVSKTEQDENTPHVSYLVVK